MKHRVPIWKKEDYVDGDSGWVNCGRYAAHSHEHNEIHAAGGKGGDATPPAECDARGGWGFGTAHPRRSGCRSYRYLRAQSPLIEVEVHPQLGHGGHQRLSYALYPNCNSIFHPYLAEKFPYSIRGPLLYWPLSMRSTAWRHHSSGLATR